MDSVQAGFYRLPKLHYRRQHHRTALLSAVKGLKLDILPQTILDSVALIPLPPLPQVLVRFLALAGDEQVPPAGLVPLVAQDPAFSAQILAVASSPPYSQRFNTVSMEQAIAVLGLPLVRTMAGCMAVQNTQARAVYERNFDHAGFWCHSLRVAALAEALAGASGYDNREEAYLAGLLHDIGQLLLVGGLGEYCQTLPAQSGQEKSLADLTQTLNGIDQALLGSRLVDSWHLPSFMADAVLFHRFPAEQIGTADLLCRIVWSAHRLSNCGRDFETAAGQSPEIAAIPELLNLAPAALDGICGPALDWAAERAAFFGVPEATASQTRTFIFPYLSLPKLESGNAAQLQLEALARNRAAIQPLQQNLQTFAGETDLVAALREAARLLFGLQRPVFLFPLADRPLLTAAASPGQPALLAKLAIPLEPGLSLAAAALQEQVPRSSFDADMATTPFLADIQLARLLESQGLLCVPLGSAAQKSGVMVFGLSAAQFAGKKCLLGALQSFAMLAAGCIEAFRALQRREQELTAELGRAFEQKARKVIHEAVNPLGIINSYLNIFAEKLGSEAEAHQELNILKEEIVRVERIIRRLNDLPEQPLPAETVNVNNLIEGMLALYGESLFETRGITVTRLLAPELPLVRGDRDSLKQILVNIWKNSAEAMPDGGSFGIVTSIGGQGNDSRVEIRLSDTGPGIPDDVKERLFQPLAPDRRPENSGVGLSIVASLVERLGGEIDCVSSPGKGTVFTIRLVQMQKEIA